MEAASRRRPQQPRPTTPPPVTKRKLNFRQQHALQSLPGRIEALQKDIASLRTALAVPDLYSRDRARFDRFSAALAAKEAELAAAEEEWLELELLREEIEAG